MAAKEKVVKRTGKKAERIRKAARRAEKLAMVARSRWILGA